MGFFADLRICEFADCGFPNAALKRSLICKLSKLISYLFFLYTKSRRNNFGSNIFRFSKYEQAKNLQFVTMHDGFVIDFTKKTSISTIIFVGRYKHAVHMVQVIIVNLSFKSFQKTIIILIPPE